MVNNWEGTRDGIGGLPTLGNRAQIEKKRMITNEGARCKVD